MSAAIRTFTYPDYLRSLGRILYIWPMSRQKLALSLALAGALTACVPTAAQAKSQGNLAAAMPVVSKLRQAYPRSSQRFVNCPGRNRYTDAGVDVVVCEFRIAKRGMTIRGTAGASPPPNRNRRWRLHGFYPAHPVPQRWKRCSVARLDGPARTARSLRVSGVNCLNAFYIAAGIGSEALNNGLRLPHRFTEAFYSGSFTRGFITNTFHCRGSIEIRQGPENPYGHETARCRTRLGDHLTFVFDQGS